MASRSTGDLESSQERPVAERGDSSESLGDLVSAITSDLSTLVRSEIALAKSELKVEAKNGALGAAFFVVAGLLGVVVFLFLSVTFAELLALALPRWVAYLVVALVYAVIAGVLALLGKKRISTVGAPERTVRTIKDDVAWAKNPTEAPEPTRNG